MFKNYLKIALRNILKNKGFSFINIAGLAIGMVCTIIIFFWITNQVNFDKSQVNRKRIYRVEDVDWVDMPPFLPGLISNLPEIRKFVRFDSWQTPVLKHKNYLSEVDNFVFADDTVFDVFTLPFIQGDPEKALETPFSLVLSESLAAKIFGRENPLGKIVKYDNTFNFTVTGVIKDVNKFHVKMNAIAPIESLPVVKNNKDFLKQNAWNHPTYLLLAPNVSISALERKINNRLREQDKNFNDNNFFLRPFNEIYFENKLKHEKGCVHGNMNLILLFSAIAIFILIIACINFINLTTARSAKRAKEVSVRKVVGADRKNLARQFFSETLLVALFAYAIALLLIKTIVPLFNYISGENLAINLLDPGLIAISAAVFFFTGITAGIYPSLYLSALSPFALLKGKNTGKGKNAPLRKLLIVIQFSISVFLIISTLIVLRQINFMKNADVGFTRDQVITLNLKGELLNAQKKLSFKNRLLRNPDIAAVSYSNQAPGNLTNTITWLVKGEEKPMVVIDSDPAFLELMELKLLAGRNLSWDLRTDQKTKYIINEAAVKHLGFDSPVGQTVRANWGNSEIIGVVKDFHYNSLHNRIGPIAIYWNETWSRIAHIKLSGTNLSRTIKSIEKVWAEFAPGFPFAYSFMDESFGRQYDKENRLAETLKYFALLAIFLSNLGLFGLTAFSAEQRTKEIGIRKALGASSSSIVTLLSGEFLRWVLIANILAWPAAYFLMRNWLRNFAYHTGMTIGLFVMSGLLALIVAIVTVAYQSIKAATEKPVNALKYE